MLTVELMIYGGPWNGSTFNSQDVDEGRSNFAILCYEATNLGEPERVFNSMAVHELNLLREADGREPYSTMVTHQYKIRDRHVQNNDEEVTVSLEVEFLTEPLSHGPGTVRLFEEGETPPRDDN